ncbi:MAG: SOS response-associated peptidase [Janthinobacterium lividum]
MCGRYAVSARPERLADQFDVIDIFEGLPEPDYNVAPTVSVPAVLERTVKTATTGSADAPVPGAVRRRLAPLTWGLVPSWAKDRSIGSRLINARVETVAEKPAFRKAFAARRCLLPADGFYEWYTPDGHDSDTPQRRGKVRKQPFFLHRRDGGLLVMAGLYEIWRDPALDREDDAAWLRTCTVITTEATDAAGHIHDRMPMVVRPDAVDAWLDPTLTDPGRVLDLLATDADELEAYAVSSEVNSVKNNGPDLLLPLPTHPGPVDGPDGPEQAPLL